MDRVDPALGRLRAAIPRGPGGPMSYTAFLARAPIPEVGIREGDFLLKLSRNHKSLWVEDYIQGRLERVPRSRFPALVSALDRLRFVESDRESQEALLRYLRRRPGVQPGKENTSQLFILRPIRSGVSAPIRAESCEEALSQLLRDAGCRLPGPDGLERS